MLKQLNRLDFFKFLFSIDTRFYWGEPAGLLLKTNIVTNKDWVLKEYFVNWRKLRKELNLSWALVRPHPNPSPKERGFTADEEYSSWFDNFDETIPFRKKTDDD